MGNLIAPALIAPVHSADNFDCGITSLNQWIRRQALKNEASGASWTFVVCSGKEVIGYYALATGSVMRQQAPGKVEERAAAITAAFPRNPQRAVDQGSGQQSNPG